MTRIHLATAPMVDSSVLSPSQNEQGVGSGNLAKRLSLKEERAVSSTLDELQKLTSHSEVQAQLRLLMEEETAIDLNLDNIMKRQTQLENHMETLDALRPRIGSLRKDAVRLTSVLLDTSNLAERISGKVRQLDLEQSRVKSTIGLVEDIQELKKCASGVQKALEGNDYELAAHFISRFLSFDPILVDKIFSGDAAGDLYLVAADTSENASGKTPLNTLNEAQQTLTDIAMDEFDNAVQGGNEEHILRFFKLFPLIGHHEVGLDKFSAYICGSISRQCQDNMREVSERPQSHAGLLTRLFETIAMVIDRQEAMVDSTYGPGRMLRVIQRLQREADIQSSIILNSFTEKQQLQRKLVDITRYEESTRRRSGQIDLDSLVEPKEVDAILNEVALMSQKSRFFSRFLHVRAEAEAIKVRAAPLKGSDWTCKLDGEGDGLVKTSKLDEAMQKLMSDYIRLEEYFIRRSIQKAINIDTWDKNDISSSCVEDVFYILKTCTRRALSTTDPDCICAIINGVGRILELDYINCFQTRLGAAFSTDSKDSRDRMGHIIWLNNIDVSCDYTVKLTEELMGEVEPLFKSTTDLSLAKIRACLAVLSEYADSFRNILKTWIDNLFKQQMTPRLRPLLQQAYMDVKYVLNEDEYATQNADELFAKRFIAGIEKMLRSYQKTYTEWNYNQTTVCLIDHVAKEWERYLMQNHKFNQFGALRFDRDLRAVSSYLSSTTSWSSRDKFTRLSQISTVLNMEKVEEIRDIWGKVSPITWRLTAKDVRKILGLRVDFNAGDVASLEL